MKWKLLDRLFFSRHFKAVKRPTYLQDRCTSLGNQEEYGSKLLAVNKEFQKRISRGGKTSPLLNQKFPTTTPLQGAVLKGEMSASNSVDDFTIVSNLYAKML